MFGSDALLQAAALLAAAATAFAVDRASVRRGLLPPGLRDPRRRALAGTWLAVVLWLAVFAPALAFRDPPRVDLETIRTPTLFVLQLLLLLTVAVWAALGYAGVAGIAPRAAVAAAARRLGLRPRGLGEELRVGVVAGVAAWAAVLAAALALGLGMRFFGVERALGEPSEVIVWMAAQPVALRLAISLAAGVGEEIFFRGFLQPRIGILFSTALFVGAHASYGQPVMLFGVTLLSLFYAALARRRGSVWAPIVAHFLFDAIQLLVVIPAVLELERFD